MQIPRLKSGSVVFTIIWILYVPGFTSITPLVILILLYYIEVQWLVNAVFCAGIDVAYSWIKGVSSTYYLLAASLLFTGKTIPVSVISVNCRMLFVLSRVITEDPSIVCTILSESICIPS